MPPKRRKKFDAAQYARLKQCSQAMDFTEWNAWYAGYLKENLFLRSSTESYGAHLEGADLSYWYLEGADLRSALLENADLSYTYLKNARLENANLTGANLWRAFLGGAFLAGANPDAARYDAAGKMKYKPVVATLLRECAVNGTIARWNVWYKNDLALNAPGSPNYGAYLEEAHLRDLDLSRAYLQYAHLEGADLRNVRLCGADLRYSHLEGADLWQADLQDADLTHAELGGANLAGANLTNTKF